MDKKTRLLHQFENPDQYFGAVVPPVVSTSLFAFQGFDDLRDNVNREGRYYYSRSSNPTVDLLERKLALLENGEACRCFSSGMAAVSAAILSQVRPGDHVVCVKSVYGGTNALLTEYLPQFGVETTFVEGNDPLDYANATRPNTKLYYLESPSSFLFHMQDLEAIASHAKERGIFTIIDNSWATPLYQNPLDHGIDLVVHSLTKYVGGHSDVVAGAAIGGKDVISAIAKREGALLGGCLSPMQAWLLLRGLRTLAARVERHQRSTLQIVETLSRHPLVERIYYPGSPDFPQQELAAKYLKGYTGLFAIRLRGGLEKVRDFVERLQLFQIGCSWGGFESLALPPVAVGQAVLEWGSAADGEWTDISGSLVRLSVGLEEPEDLLADLLQALGQ